MTRAFYYYANVCTKNLNIFNIMFELNIIQQLLFIWYCFYGISLPKGKGVPRSFVYSNQIIVIKIEVFQKLLGISNAAFFIAKINKNTYLKIVLFLVTTYNHLILCNI